ncbi:MAG: FGGY family carbohydrate kinase, partial [Eubacteriales bacterium]|nr:FGGY family carbohydrate kinase [Eubacteriales bacterium]
MGRFILTLDQGTTSSRAIVFDREGSIVSSGQVSFRQYYPKPGWVEHDPDQIWESQILAVEQALETIGPDDIGAVGITNQRETTVLWDRITGKPLHPAIVWQCRRTAHICDDLKSQGLEDYVRNTTGLLIDAYFSATKIKWILDSDPVIRDKAVRGEVCFGTVDSWLLYKLTGGRVHATDVTNASRTMLWDINRMCWDERLL